METNSKTIAIVSYITFIGWIIALLMRNANQDQSKLVQFHLRQAFGLGVSNFILSSLLGALHLWVFTQILNVAVFVLIVVGILNANAGKEDPLPFVGKYFQDKLTFIR